MRKEFEEIKEKKIPLSKWDLIILGIVIILAISLIAVSFARTSTPTVCKIYRDGNCVKTIKLSELGSENAFGGEVGSRVYEYNDVRIVVYKDGAEITQSACYDEACVKAKKITQKGECIECVPSQIAVTLE